MYIAENLEHLKELLFIRKIWAQDIDVSNVVYFFLLFYKRTEDDFRGYISDWDVSCVINMDATFSNSGITNQDIARWDVQNVQNMGSMFAYSKFNGDISNWNIKNVVRMNNMFEFSEFNRDISKWNVSNVQNMSWMFESSKFNGDISKWNVSNVRNMTWMFSYSTFDGDISNWNIQSLKTSLEDIFENSKLKIPETWKIQKLLVGGSCT